MRMQIKAVRGLGANLDALGNGDLDVAGQADGAASQLCIVLEAIDVQHRVDVDQRLVVGPQGVVAGRRLLLPVEGCRLLLPVGGRLLAVGRSLLPVRGSLHRAQSFKRPNLGGYGRLHLQWVLAGITLDSSASRAGPRASHHDPLQII